MIDSLDTEQTEDDTLSSKPIGPKLDDSEQLTGESIQPYLTLEGQLQCLVTLGRFGIHAQVTSMSRFRSAPRKLQRIYGYVKKTINFHWSQSKYYLSEMLSKHWDLFKILPKITKLFMTCVPITSFLRSAFMETPMLSKQMGYQHHTKVPSSTHTHTHKITYI